MDKQTIVHVLGDNNEKDRYYVYALCDESGKPFYIGKGQGERVWQHEEGEEAERLEIEKLYQTGEITEQERDERLNNASNKYKRIREFEASGKEPQKVIVKWGLTEHESFMVEAALINLLNYPSVSLTNIANGHASKREDASPSGSKALSVDSFFIENCQKPLSLAEIPSKRIFVCINSLYEQCLAYPEDDRASKIKDAARGCWDTTKELDYLIAVYKGIIRGFYRVNERISICDITTQTIDKFPNYPEAHKEEKKVLSTILNKHGSIPSDYSLLNDEEQSLFADYTLNYNANFKNKSEEARIDYSEEYSRWINLSFFDVKEDENSNTFTDRVIRKENGHSVFQGGASRVYLE